MSAPSIRCTEIARELAARGLSVTLSIPNVPEVAIDGVRQTRSHRQALSGELTAADVLILGGAGHHIMPLPSIPHRLPLAIDLSSPLILEASAAPGVPRTDWPPPIPMRDLARRLSLYLLEGDFLMCASEQQREYYLGCMSMTGRLSGSGLVADPSLRSLLSVVPFGCSGSPPKRTGPGFRDLMPGVKTGDFVLLWSGGLADWYDPETVVTAVELAAQSVPSLRLVFMGNSPGVSHLPTTQTAARLRELVRSKGLEGRHVFFADAWIPYEERVNWLLDADVAVFASRSSIESDLAIRIRILDYFWSATPILCTRGGAYTDEIERAGLGLVVAPGDAIGMSAAIVTMANSSVRLEIRGRLEGVRSQHTWQAAVEPLVRFCEAPHLADDRRNRSRWSHDSARIGWLRAADTVHTYKNGAQGRLTRLRRDRRR